MKLTVANVARYVALLAAMAISFTTQRELALSHGVPVSVAFAVPLAIDAFMIWSVRTRRDIALSVSVAVAANVAGVLTVDPLSAVGTWVAAGLHAVFPFTVYRMHRAESATRPSESVADSAPDTGPDMTESAPDTAAETPDGPPTEEDIRAAVTVLESRHGRPLTGQIVAEHFGVSARTGRRYLDRIGYTTKADA
ncbi:transfer protein spdA [Streptomyces sp. CNZ748]|uniref:transfer protein spdA n=1 Tax=Streptomyces sp. CNZ748 TaxID=2885160 RepID=UPI001E39EA7A|nr:transfer protein spdA [Streptomyces sp. CNZ748]